MDHHLDPEFDFSELDMEDLRRMGVSLREIKAVIKNARTRAYNTPGRSLQEYEYCMIGFTSQARGLFILLKFHNDRYYVKDINFAYEKDIEELWCERHS